MVPLDLLPLMTVEGAGDCRVALIVREEPVVEARVSSSVLRRCIDGIVGGCEDEDAVGKGGGGCDADDDDCGGK